MIKTQVRNAIAVMVLIWGTLLSSCKPQSSPTSTETAQPPSTPATTATPVASHTTSAPTPQAQAQTPTTLPVQATPIGAAALVNGHPIPLTAYEAQVAQAVAVLSEQQNLDHQTQEGQAAILQLRSQILDAMIDQALIQQAAKNEGLTVSEDQVEEELVRLVADDTAQFDDWLEANGLTRDGFKAQLQEQMLSAKLQEHLLGADAPTVEQVHARHILVATEEEAMDVLLRLRAGDSFAALAKENSLDQATSANGGDLGFFPRNVMPQAIEAVAFGLAPGQVSGIVQTDFGYHIIEVLEKDNARTVPEDMMATWRQNSFLQWLRAQRSVAKIEYLAPQE